MSKLIVLEKPFLLKPYGKKELSAIMKVSEYVLGVWIKEIENEVGKPKAGVYSVIQVKKIIETYGLPEQVTAIAA